MNKVRPVLMFVLGFALVQLMLHFVASVPAAHGQNVVKADQGKPGTQGPWPVTGASASSPGGLATRPVVCSAVNSKHTTISVSTSAAAITPTAAGRAYSVICVSPETSGTPNVRCRADGTLPTNSTGATGDVLTTGDCLVYTTPSDGGTDPIGCVGSAAAYVTVYQCVP